MTPRIIIVVAVGLLSAGLLCAETRGARLLSMEDAWIREAPPAANVMAAYLTAKNTGHTPATIVSIASPVFKSIEIHQTTINNGIARMLPVSNLVIKPMSEIHLEPGGIHLMLIGPNRVLRVGDEVKLSFTLDDGSTLSIMAPVIKQSPVR